MTGTPLPDNLKVKVDDLREHLQQQRVQLEQFLHGVPPEVLQVLVRLARFSNLPVHAVDALFRKKLQLQEDKRGLQGGCVQILIFARD